MDIKTNPFISNTFNTKWQDHFGKNKSTENFKFIEKISFYKTSKFNIYINSGQNLTKGILYKTNNVDSLNFNNAVALIYDVPEYFNVKNSILPKNIKISKIKQYPGYLTELDKFKDLDEYLKTTFSKKSRAKLNRYQKRLELCFNISYKMYFGEISKEKYDKIFAVFRLILVKRFTSKQITNNNLETDEWNFYYDLAYELILEKKASLFVIYEGKNPIGITLNYLSKDILFHGITTFDIDYSKFHLGKVMLKNLFKWCFENNIKTLDFSKGHFDYKTEWMTKKYDFEYHIFINQSSFKSKLKGFLIKKSLIIKQYLRDKELNKKLHQFTFKFSKKEHKTSKKLYFTFSDYNKKIPDSLCSKIDLQLEENQFLKVYVNEFLFLNSEKLKDFKIFSINNNEANYLLIGLKIKKILLIKKE